MRNLLRLILVLALLGAIGLIAFAYFGDMSPDQSQTETPVTLDLN